MNLKKLLLVSLTSFLLFGTYLTSFNIDNRFNIDALGDNMRRIYAYPEFAMNKDGWGDDSLYIHYWGGSSSSTYAVAPEMILAVSDYYLGLVYYDIPADSTNFMISSYQNTSNDWEKTVDVTLNVDNKFFGFKIINEYVSGKVNVYQENIGMSAEEFTGILAKIDSCGLGYASGYNSYEYIIRTFIQKSDDTNIMGSTEQNKFSTTFFADMNENATFSIDGLNRTANNTSISQKLTIMQRQYNANVANTDINYI